MNINIKNKLRNSYLGLKFSFSFFSILPVTFKTNDNLSEKEVLTYMLLSLPLVGLILGVVTTFIFSLLSSLTWYGATISALLYMLLYGFIHTEAVIDVVDAIYASHSGKDAYKVIKESTVGAMGVLYAIAFILLKISGIVYILNHGLSMEFIAVLIISRLSLLLLFKVHSFNSNFATTLKESFDLKYFVIAYLIFISIGLYLTSNFIFLLLFALSLAIFISFSIKSKIGFVNGDVLGATLESIEILLFLTLALFML